MPSPFGWFRLFRFGLFLADFVQILFNQLVIVNDPRHYRFTVSDMQSHFNVGHAAMHMRFVETINIDNLVVLVEFVGVYSLGVISPF